MTEFDYSNMTPADVLVAVSTAAEAIRFVNHATLGPNVALEYPSDVDTVLVELESIARRLPQLLEHLGSWLGAEAKAGYLEVTSGKFTAKPELAADVARTSLDVAAARFQDAETALIAAHKITATMASATISEEES